MKDEAKEAEGVIPRKSELRQEIEALLERKGLTLESRISVINLESGEIHYFDSYPEALQFLKGKKGRWYIAAPGLRHSRKDR